jgi:hypothetical protein
MVRTLDEPIDFYYSHVIPGHVHYSILFILLLLAIIMIASIQNYASTDWFHPWFVVCGCKVINDVTLLDRARETPTYVFSAPLKPTATCSLHNCLRP